MLLSVQWWAIVLRTMTSGGLCHMFYKKKDGAQLQSQTTQAWRGENEGHLFYCEMSGIPSELSPLITRGTWIATQYHWRGEERRADGKRNPCVTQAVTLHPRSCCFVWFPQGEADEEREPICQTETETWGGWCIHSLITGTAKWNFWNLRPGVEA